MKKKSHAIHYLISSFAMLVGALLLSLGGDWSKFPLCFLSMVMELCAIISLFRGVAYLNDAGVLAFSAKSALKGEAIALPCAIGILVAILVAAWMGIYENVALTSWVIFVGVFIGALFSFYEAGLRLTKNPENCL